MNVFAINLLIAGVWAALAGPITLTSLATGYVLGFLALWVVRPLFGNDGYFMRVPRLIWLVLVFLGELVMSSLRVAWDVVSPAQHSRPGIIAVPIRTRNETETLLLSSMVSLTPGSLSLDLNDAGDVLYVHAMFADDSDLVRQDIHEKLEQPLLEALG